MIGGQPALCVSVQQSDLAVRAFRAGRVHRTAFQLRQERYRGLKQFRKTDVWKASLEDFHRLFEAPKSYRPSELNRYVLKPIESELGPLLGLKVHRKYLTGWSNARR